MINMADRLAIHELYARYNIAADINDVETWAGCFTEDGVFNGTEKLAGRTQLISFAERRRAIADSHEFHSAQHWNSSLILLQSSDCIEGFCYVMQFATSKESNEVTALVAGSYHDRITFSDEGWLFASRTFFRAMADFGEELRRRGRW
jgi:hypothetical protein